MAARDPSTGQFIPAGAARTKDAAYEDFDIQQVHVEISTGAGLGSAITTFEDWHTSEPLGGLQRDELAELVALMVDVYNEPEGSAEVAGRVGVRGELSLDSDPHLVDLDDAVLTSDVDGITDLDRRVWELESDPDVLDRWMTYGVNHDDETNGLSNSSETVYSRTYAYRPVFGRGPVLDRHSDLHWHIDLDTNGDPRHKLSWFTTFVWDVFART